MTKPQELSKTCKHKHTYIRAILKHTITHTYREKHMHQVLSLFQRWKITYTVHLLKYCTSTIFKDLTTSNSCYFLFLLPLQKNISQAKHIRYSMMCYYG